MRVLKTSIALLTAIIMVSGTGVAAAQTISVSGTLHIEATVLPVHTVVVDSSGQILQIFSNTETPTQNVKVFVGNADTGEAIQLTDSIYQQYRQLVPPSQSRIGKLYDRNSPATVLVLPANSPLRAKSSSLLQTF